MKKKSPLVSIIIPTYNEERYIEKCLKSIENQSFDDYEIIIVDDGSKDKTREIIKKYDKVRLIEGKHKGPGFSRNIGVNKAKGEIFVFVDADMEFEKDYLKNLLNPIISSKEVIGTTHDYEIAINTNNLWSRCWGKHRSDERHLRGTGKVVKANSIFRAIRKKNFMEMGGFDPKFGYADDRTFSYKYNAWPQIAENTTCYHRNPETLKEVFKQSRWIGASSDNKLLRMNQIKYLIPLLMVLISPVAVIFLSIRKILVVKKIKVILPMLPFMVVRYAGMITGLSRKIYLNKNIQ